MATIAGPSSMSTTATTTTILSSDGNILQATSSASTPLEAMRRAALSTIKTKRQKLSNGTQSSDSVSLPARVAAGSSSVQLDYGLEESLPSASTDIPPTNLMDVEDGELKEEGEISDSETTPATSKPFPLSKLDNLPAKTPPATVVQASSPPVSPSSIASSPAMVKSEIPKTMLPPPLKLAKSGPSAPLQPPITANLQLTASVLQNSASLVDADHVRPGLAMTQAEYNTAKDIILDLLGWGIPPEFLVDCGLSRQIIFYVFNELNLRLPANLDTTGIIPYLPPSEMPPPPTPPKTSSPIQTHRTHSNAMPPPTRVVSAPDPSSSSIAPQSPGISMRRPSTGHPLPPKPIAPQGSPELAQPVSPSNQPAASTSASAISLHDMEQQRREELLRRKAVLASRKSKQQQPQGLFESPTTPAAVGPSISIPDEPIDMEMATPLESVEDFLKSIGPVLQTSNGEEDTNGAGQSSDAHALLDGGHGTFGSPEPMEPETPMDTEEDAIPGFGTHTNGRPPPLSPELSITSVSTHASAPPPPTSASSTSASSVSASGSSMLTDAISVDPPTSANGVQRRGVKRPVAADFVDLDNTSGPSRTNSMSGAYMSDAYAQYHAGMPHPLSRRKQGSFASVSGMRRCVIDLSDSEDEGHVSADVLGDAERPQSRLAHGMGMRNNVPTPPPSSSTSGGMLSSAGLAEKELEIKRMREMIALREQNRLKKLAAMSNAAISTSTSPAPVASTAPASALAHSPLSIQQDYDESASSTSLSHSNGTPFTSQHQPLPPPDVDKADEDIIMDDLVVSESRSGSSTSHTPIPIDIIADESFQDENVGENVLTAEAEDEIGQEQVVDLEDAESNLLPRGQEQERVEDDIRLVEEQQERQEEEARTGREGWHIYEAYDSPFMSYPHLRSQPEQAARMITSSSQNASVSEAAAASSGPHPQLVMMDFLRPLKMAAQARVGGGGACVCVYEVPGGGTCKDPKCTDVHLGGLEPSDEDTARYLVENVPDLRSLAVNDIVDALGRARARIRNRIRTRGLGPLGDSDTGSSFDECVVEAMGLLGAR